MPIKILHLITTLDTGGAEMMLLKLLSSIDRNRFNNHVVCMVPPGRVGALIAELDIPVESLYMRKGVRSLNAPARLCSIMRRLNPDIVQTWMYHADLLGLVASKLSGIGKVLWNIRCADMDLSTYARTTFLTFRACRYLSAFPDAVVANSDMARAYHVQKGYHPKQFDVILNGFDLKKFKPDHDARRKIRIELGIKNDTPLIGHIGRFDPMKDHRTFINAARIVCSRQPNTHFLLCGKGVDCTNAKMDAMLDTCKAKRNFHLLGERHDIPFILASLDLFVSSSVSESFSNVIGEAMACEIPCVVTDVGDSARIVGNTGRVVKPASHVELAEAILEMIAAQSNDHAVFGHAARERIHNKYSINRIVKQYQELYQSQIQR